jgi:hypothetical protein
MGTTRLRLRFPSPALILSCLALFAALGGSTYAAASSGSSGIHFTKATLENGWTESGSGSAAAGYAKDSIGVVHLRGGIKGGGNNNPAFVLPLSLRPKHYLYLPVQTYLANDGSVDISPNGEVTPLGNNATGFTSLDGISFVAGQ